MRLQSKTQSQEVHFALLSKARALGGAMLQKNCLFIPQKSPIISGYFVKNDLQLELSNGSSNLPLLKGFKNTSTQKVHRPRYQSPLHFGIGNS